MRVCVDAFGSKKTFSRKTRQKESQTPATNTREKGLRSRYKRQLPRETERSVSSRPLGPPLVRSALPRAYIRRSTSFTRDALNSRLTRSFSSLPVHRLNSVLRARVWISFVHHREHYWFFKRRCQSSIWRWSNKGKLVCILISYISVWAVGQLFEDLSLTHLSLQ